MKQITTYLISIFLLFSLQLTAQEDCWPKKEKRLVYDLSNTLSENEIYQLEGRLENFANSTSTQIAIVIVTDLCGYDRASFTYNLGEAWGVGQSGSDNGVVIMVKPKEVDGRGEAFIATGYGLEAVIPDAIAKRIVENEMIPRFKQKDYYGGLVAAIDVIMKLAEGEFNASDYKQKTQEEGTWIPFVMFVFIMVIVIISRIGSARRYARSNNTSLWLALMLMNSSSRGRSGGFGSFSSGGGSFGGFGGGSFGGGGAGGSW